MIKPPKDPKEAFFFFNALDELSDNKDFQLVISHLETELSRLDKSNRTAQDRTLMNGQGAAQTLEKLLGFVADARTEKQTFRDIVKSQEHR